MRQLHFTPRVKRSDVTNVHYILLPWQLLVLGDIQDLSFTLNMCPSMQVPCMPAFNVDVNEDGLMLHLMHLPPLSPSPPSLLFPHISR